MPVLCLKVADVNFRKNQAESARVFFVNYECRQFLTRGAIMLPPPPPPRQVGVTTPTMFVQGASRVFLSNFVSNRVLTNKIFTFLIICENPQPSLTKLSLCDC